METTSAVPLASPASPSFLVRRQFLIYRLFSLSGLVPIGAYLCVHLITNASILNGPATYQSQVDQIHSLGIVLPLVEWVFIFLPILFHAVVGWYIISGAIPNTASYPYAGNIRYVLQRVTGMIAFVFIVVHVIHMHQLLGAPFKPFGAKFDAEHAASSAGKAVQAALWIQILYVIGITASVYHLSNGLWTAGITWGIWQSKAAQRRANYVSIVFGAVLLAIGLGAFVGTNTIDVEHARKIEDRKAAAKKLINGEETPLDESLIPTGATSRGGDSKTGK